MIFRRKLDTAAAQARLDVLQGELKKLTSQPWHITVNVKSPRPPRVRFRSAWHAAWREFWR